jgi:FkbM family methyltransferase
MGFADGEIDPTREDAWVTKVFPRDFVGYAVEVGAYNGQAGSTTLALQQAGWTTLAIEPNPDLEPGLKLCRPLYRMYACGSASGEAEFHINEADPPCYSSLNPTKNHPVWHPAEGAIWKTVTVPVRTLDSILDEVAFTQLDFLSIDTEGTELDVLNGFTMSRWKPKVVIVESWDDQSPVIAWMENRAYKRVHRHVVNDFFVPREVQL